MGSRTCTRLTLVLSGLVGLGVACAGPKSESQSLAGVATAPRPRSASTPRPAVQLVPQDRDQGLEKLGPEILLPTRQPADDKVTEVAGVVIRKSHVYDRWLERDPNGAKWFVDLLFFDALLAQEAKRHGITVDPDQIDKAVDRAIKRLQAQVEKDWQGEYTFAEFCQFQFGVGPEAYRRWRRLQMARDLYRCYVIRYLATLEDRVQARVFAHSDRKVVEDVHRRTKEGADFKSLVLRKRSQHKPSNKNGGLLPPFYRDQPGPMTEQAFRMKPGELSDVLELQGEGGAKMYYVLFCLSWTPARARSFKEARKDLYEELSRNPVTDEERRATYIRLRSRSEALKNPSKQR